MSHQMETCPKPRAAKRWRNTIWVCPECGSAWTLRRSLMVPPKRHPDHVPPPERGALGVEVPLLAHSTFEWGWWPWPPGQMANYW
jgi:hypothetical protein